MNSPSALIRDSLTFVCTIRAMHSIDLRELRGWPTNPRDWGWHADCWAEVVTQLNTRHNIEHRHAILLYDCYLTAEAPVHHFISSDWDYTVNRRHFSVTADAKTIDTPRKSGRPKKYNPI